MGVFRGYSIRRKLTIIMMLTSGVALLLACTAFLVYEWCTFRQNAATDLETLAKGLLEYETLSGDEITDLLNGKKPNRESMLEPSGPRTSAVPPAGKPRPRPDTDPGLEPQPQA